MQSAVRRAAAFALVGTLAVSSPLVGPIAAVPFALVAVFARLVSGGPAFELFARPADRRAGQLHGLVGFSLAATGLGLLTAPAIAGLPAGVFVSAVLLVAYGNLAETVACERHDTPFRRAVGFGAGGALAAFVGQALGSVLARAGPDLALAAFLATSGALVGALLRESLPGHDDPAVLSTVTMVLWVLASLGLDVNPGGVVLAIAVAGTMGYVAWLLGTASVTGMLTGVLTGLVTIVLGGLGWFVALIAFFGVGAVASKYRYEEKRALGVAQSNEGARGTRNVLANASVAVLAVVGFAASPAIPADPSLFRLAFAGSLATAMSDTLSSELGVLYGKPRLITTYERVEVGTDGGVTLEGGLAGVAGAAIVAAVVFALLEVAPLGAAAVLVGGTVGMAIDSLLGATLEGRWMGNQTVNFLATLSGALVATGVGLALGLATV